MWAATVLIGCGIAPLHCFGFQISVQVFAGGNDGIDRSCHASRGGGLTGVHSGSRLFNRFPIVWVEDSEDDFVDEDENLEDGEVCLKSLKAFSSKPVAATEDDNDDGDYFAEPRFLCAGALVQRRPESQVCDAWTADSILMEGGPNLQLQGAVKVLDELLLFQLQRHSDNTILALQNFVVKCGSLDSEYTCASYMAAIARGFRPLKELVRVDSVYTSSYYDNDLDGLVMDAEEGRDLYRKLASIENDESSKLSIDDLRIVSTIYRLLPDDDTIRRFTHKRYTSPRK